MFLGVVEVVFAQALGVQAGVDVALEREQGLLGVLRGEGGGPTAEAGGVQPGQLVGQVHQLADLLWRQFAQLQDQFLGVVQVLRLGMPRNDRRCFKVEGLGRGNHRQHV
ncbi:hypothetical protein D3C80_1877830 [compost metagenome]